MVNTLLGVTSCGLLWNSVEEGHYRIFTMVCIFLLFHAVISSLVATGSLNELQIAFVSRETLKVCYHGNDI